jgi:hypothetical protein
MLDGPLPEEPSPDEKAPASEPYDPDNPTPDWKNHQRAPGESKMPRVNQPKE